jgi:hypothetical protein
MAKDPAVLFYTQDFLVGTMTMNYEQKGKYITLLCLQHQKGKLTLKDLQSILNEEDVDVAEKFIKESDGFYYNQKLKFESERRKNYSESRRKNLMNKHKNSHMVNDINSHLETGTGTGTVTGNKTEIENETSITSKYSTEDNKIDFDKLYEVFNNVKSGLDSNKSVDELMEILIQNISKCSEYLTDSDEVQDVIEVLTEWKNEKKFSGRIYFSLMDLMDIINQ